jgi:adenylate cyclase
MRGNALNYSITIEIQAPVARLWPLLSDTDRVNRMLGLPASEQITPNADGSRTINGHFLGVGVSWQEHPFEWIFEQWFEVTRVFLAPFPVENLITRTVLVPLSPNTTRVDVSVTQTARSALGGGPARLFVEQKFLRDMRRVYTKLGQIAAESTDYTPPPPLIAPTVNAGRLERARQRLRDSGVSEAIVSRLVQHIRSADDPDVIKIRPFVLADRWGIPRLEMLRAFLYATRNGLLDLEWDVICPNCRGASVRAGRMSDLAGQAHCPSCQIRYDVDFEESVELRFSVSADIRAANDATFCSGGPANTRHILSQLWVEPHSARKLHIRLDQGSYRLRSGQIAGRALLTVAEDGPASTGLIRLNDQEIEAPEAMLAAGDAMLTLQNESDQRILLIIEQSAWNLQAASAALVTALDEFRQMFSSEILAPGLGVAIRTLTFLFSDLKDSTQIYDQIGDTPAYARVRDHFDVMRTIIAQQNGALVKTIGDAVMAVFRTTEDAMRAAISIQREFGSGPIAQVNPTLRVKLGLHSGPCIAVNANDLLDYFGSTVNIAARVQSESVGGDIVVTDMILDDPAVRKIVDHEQIVSESFERSLKGFTRSFTLARLWLPVEQPSEVTR